MIALLTFLLGTALAGNAVDMEATTTVGVGTDPSVTFKGGARGHIDVNLSCAGKRYSLSEDITMGSSDTLTLAGLSPGEHRCTGKLTVRTDDGGTGEAPLDFRVAIVGAVQIAWDAADFDLDGKTMKISTNRPMVDIQVDVYGGEAGERIGGGRQPGNNQTEARVGWSSEGETLKIDITVTDEVGTKSVLTLLPWSYAIPHEDVVFESNQAVVRESEAPKLEEAWGHIEETLGKYGDIVEMQLYVAGYTDTVGDPASNRALSQRRARAIGQWFRNRGFSRPIFVQGFGEEVLAVPTADGVDEAANRRALYVLAARTPSTSTDLPRSDWQKL